MHGSYYIYFIINSFLFLYQKQKYKNKDKESKYQKGLVRKICEHKQRDDKTQKAPKSLYKNTKIRIKKESTKKG